MTNETYGPDYDTRWEEGGRPRFSLVGVDGNAFAVMGSWKRAAQDAGWPPDAISAVLKEAMAGDYDHLLATILDNSEAEDD